MGKDLTREEIGQWRHRFQKFWNDTETEILCDMALRARATEPPPAQDADLQTGTFGLPAYLHSTAQDKLPEAITKLKLLSQEGCDMHGDDLLPIIATLERLAAPPAQDKLPEDVRLTIDEMLEDADHRLKVWGSKHSAGQRAKREATALRTLLERLAAPGGRGS